ncbi:hypothetical protein L6452_38591 [Arctium lappa]|uniref:Uncharacterized protein n=1 Tax=Arctium lappa TaxID=4217 RepID=A0ACB8XPK5_ARCLA|nr:hypothetical protein L6452_38591 [Arctium lappa]
MSKQELIHLEEALPEAPPATASAAVRATYTRMFNEQQEVAALMLVSMTPEIQKNLEELTAFEMLRELKNMFQQQVEQELFEIVKASTLVNRRMPKMPNKDTTVKAIRAGKIQKPKPQALGKGRGKGKYVYKPKPKIPPPAKKEHPAKDATCHHFGVIGHLRRNYPTYLIELKKNKDTPTSTSGLGCEALVKRDTPNKLEPRSIKCIFVGYPKTMMGYYFYYPPENKIFVDRYAEFLENSIILQETSGSTIDLDKIQSEDAQPSGNTSEHHAEAKHADDEPQNDAIPIRRSVRTPRAPKRYSFYVDAEEKNLGDHGEHSNYQAALLDP